jgi:DNA gyrase subunit B
MFIGDHGPSGLHYVLFHLLEFALDQHLVGNCQTVTVGLMADATCRLTYDSSAPFGSVAVLESLCQYCAPSRIPFAHPTSIVCFGQNPGGIAVAIALSSELEIAVVHDQVCRSQRFSRGLPTAPEQSLVIEEPPSTLIAFRPDEEIFRRGCRFDWNILASRLRELSYLLPGLQLKLVEHRPDSAQPVTKTFHSSTGLPEFLGTRAGERDWVNGEVFGVETEGSEQRFQLAMRWTRKPREDTLLFVNLHPARDGGTPVEGLHRAITPAIKKYGKIFGVLNDEPLTADDCRAGLTAIISVYVRQPQWLHATKDHIHNSELCPLVQKAVSRLFPLYLESHPTDAIAIARRALEAYRQRQARRKRGK